MNLQIFEMCFPESILFKANSFPNIKFLNDDNNNNYNVSSNISSSPAEYFDNFTDYQSYRSVANASGATFEFQTSGNATSSIDEELLAGLLRILRPIICVFGLVGNIFTLLFLAWKRTSLSTNGAERTVHNSFTALAVSDLLFCLTLLPYGFVRNDRFSFASRDFQLIYVTYSDAAVNLFILISTWLTVIMATNRYLAICHPFRADHVIDNRGTKISLAVIVVAAVAFNLPRLFINRIETLQCSNGGSIYLRMPGYLTSGSEAHAIYMWMHFLVGILIPLTALGFCNICLIKALRESIKVRRQYRVSTSHIDSNYRITTVLVTVVIMYIVLVSPAEILLFVQDRLYHDRTSAPALMLAVEVTNLLQMINFSSNFFFYFILNKQLRDPLRRAFSSCAFLCSEPDVGDPEQPAEMHNVTTRISYNAGKTHPAVMLA